MKTGGLTDVQVRNVEMVRKALEVADAGGLRALHERFEEFCHPDFQWFPRVIGFGKDAYSGKDGFGQYVDDMETWLDEVDLTTGEIRAVGENHVLFLGRLRLVGKGSHVPLDSEWAILYRVEAGLAQAGTAFDSYAEAEEAAAVA